MIKLSKKVEYGLISMMHMDAYAKVQVVSAREIAVKYSIPQELLGKVLQALAKSGLVESSQGVGGGYRLSRSLEEIKLGGVIEVLDGPLRIASCHGDPANCGQYAECNIKQPVFRIQAQIQDFIFNVPLAAFRSSPASAGRGA